MEARLTIPDDASLLAALHAESFGDSCWNIDHFKKNLALTTTQGLIVSIEKIPLGFILYQMVDGEAEILTFCINIKSRRIGLGQFLLKATIGRLQSQNGRRIFLEVAVDNHAAQALYKKAGFQIIGKRMGYYQRQADKIDAAILELVL